MDCSKIGDLLAQLRKEKAMTQKQLADQLGLSDKTISKWECGLGCPDVSLLAPLSQALQVELGNLLNGDLQKSDFDGGNMKKIKFYYCPDCSNVITATGQAQISCCGRILTALEATVADESHKMQRQELEDEWYLTFDHPMMKDHFIAWVAWVSYNQIIITKLYAEQNGELRLPMGRKGTLYGFCIKDGLQVYSD